MDRSGEIVIDLIIAAASVALAIVFAAIVILAVRCLRREQESPYRSPYGKVVKVFVIVGWVLTSLLLAVFCIATGPFALLCLVPIFVFTEAWRNYRASRQYALLWILTVAAERFMPLGPAVAAFARERRGSFARRARRLAELLNAGTPLPDALERVGGLLPDGALSMIRVGCQSGTLAPALRKVATDYGLRQSIWISLIGKITYLMLVPALGMMILVFIMLKIVPQFQKIFADFHLPFPPLTRTLIGMANFGGNHLLLPALFLVYLFLLYALQRYWGWVDWDLPGVSRLVRRLHSARILDGLAMVARQQRSLGDAIATLAESYPKRDIRRRLGHAEADVRAGLDWCDSLRRHDLIQRADLAILQAAQRVGNLPWALQEMADSSRRRFAYRVQAMVQLVFPLLVVALGLTVMFVVAALFLPLISLIQRLAV